MNKKVSKNKKPQQNKRPQQSIPKGASAWVLFFAACGCMFFIGVLVGRNTMPVRFDMADLNEKLGHLQKSVLTEDAGAGEPDGPIEQMPFEFYEELRDEQLYGFSDDDEMPLRLIKPKFEKKPESFASLSGVPPEDRPHRVQEKVSEKGESATAAERPVERAESRQVRQETPHAAPDPPVGRVRGGYVIQVASLRNTESAEAVRDKFRARGYPAYTQQAVVEGQGRWSRVRIGPYKDKEQARDDLVRLQQAGVDAILLLAGDE
ncbi:MAG: SPOR domain-containing protein [Desulfosalsimonadaceae bacterium]